ncbi:MAG TPA: SDR family NAD(P)-dependent oxidoreductase [Polyangiaceae bacterium]|nr:SDR family NAD(P)-dependent oxidoreductase [Polyangiaceae bacterium]
MGSGVRELDIAIIGMAARFPEAPDISSFWRNLVAGRDCIKTYSEEELRTHGVPAALYRNPRYVPRSGYLADVDKFDAELFGMSQREAELTDPQHRMLLELAFGALDEGGYGSGFDGRVGCYAAAGMSLYAGSLSNSYLTYNLLPNRERLSDVIAPMITVANCNDYLASRISYKLNLRGPALNVQTACSSGLTAVHLACQALLTGECELALAGAAAIHAPPKAGYLFEEGSLLAPDGICRPFDAAAMGTVGGNGAGMVLLKRLADARADRDFVYAVVRGSAMNNDGRDKVSFLAPSVSGQAQVIRRAMTAAEVHSRHIRYIEAHGTGTRLGDPIEVAALAEAFRDSGARAPQEILLASVKGNIGHLDTAAGIASFIKAALMLRHRTWVRTLNFDRPNPALEIGSTPFEVCAENRPFDSATDELPCVSVSALGAGGTNVHVVLQAAEIASREPPSIASQVLTISGRTVGALRRNAENLAALLESEDHPRIDDLCSSLRSGRAELEHRLVMLPQHPSEVPSLMKQAGIALEASDSIRLGRVLTQRPRIAFLFSGQGHLRSGVAATLAGLPSFRSPLDACEDTLAKILSPTSPLRHVSLSRLLLEPGHGDSLKSAAIVQPALFALQYGLAEVWSSAGVRPTVVLGHSIGEIAAACVAGVLDLRSALALAVERGALMDECCTKRGGMLAALAKPEAVEACLVEFPGLVVACYNGPLNTVVSGPVEDLDRLGEYLTSAAISYSRLSVTHAFHSSLMDPMLEAFARFVESIALGQPKLRLVSTVSGLDDSSIGTAGYWVDQVRRPVHFTTAVQAAGASADILVELGPSSVLTSLTRDVIEQRIPVIPSLNRSQAGLMRAAADLYVAGQPIAWNALGLPHGRRTPLPPYAFERTTCWIPPRPPLDDEIRAESTLPQCFAIGTNSVLRAESSRRVAARSVLLVTGPTSLGRLLQTALWRSGFLVEAIGHPSDELLARRNWTDILDLRALDTDGFEDVGEAALGVQALAQLMLRVGSSATCWFVTPEVRSLSARHSATVGAVWGLLRSVRAEHPEIEWRCVEISLRDAEASVRDLAIELDCPSHCPEVSLAHGDPRQLVATEQSTNAFDPLHLDSGATYLITGGLGALGLAIAARFVERGARNLILLARRPPTDAAAAKLALLASTGTIIDALPVDVRDRDAVSRALEPHRGSLKGIVHAAGGLEDRIFARQTPDSLTNVLGPKLLGGLNLHELAIDEPLDFFVALSSAAALLGSPGQANYSAANAGLQAMFARRRALKLPATCLHYGPWADSGMAAKHADRHQRLGAMSSEAALDALELAISAGIGEMLVVPRTEVWGTQRTIPISALAERVWSESSPGAERSPIVSIRSHSPARQREALHDYVVSAVRRVLGAPQAPVDETLTFHDLGLESLAGLQLKRLIETDLDVRLPATLIYEFPTVAHVRDHLLGLLARDTRGTPLVSTVQAPPGELDQHLVDLAVATTEGQLLRTLQQELARSSRRTGE